MTPSKNEIDGWCAQAYRNAGQELSFERAAKMFGMLERAMGVVIAHIEARYVYPEALALAREWRGEVPDDMLDRAGRIIASGAAGHTVSECVCECCAWLREWRRGRETK